MTVSDKRFGPIKLVQPRNDLLYCLCKARRVNGHICVCARNVCFASMSTITRLVFGSIPTVLWYVFVFHSIGTNEWKEPVISISSLCLPWIYTKPSIVFSKTSFFIRQGKENEKPQIEGEQTIAKQKKDRGHPTINKQNNTLRSKDRATQNPLKPGMNSSVPERLAFPALRLTPVVLLLNDTNVLWYGNSVENQYTQTNTNNRDRTWTL